MRNHRIFGLSVAALTTVGWCGQSILATAAPHTKTPIVQFGSLPPGAAFPSMRSTAAPPPSPVFTRWQDLVNTSGTAQTHDLPLLLGQNLSQAPDSSQFTGDTFNPIDLQGFDISPIIVPVPKPIPSPGTSFGVPSAFGASWGNAFVGSSGRVDLGGAGRSVDGSFSMGMGFGNARDTVGLETSLGITSISPDDFADSGSIGLKLHKVFADAGNLGLAIGWSNAIDWGDATDAQETIYGAASKTFVLRPGSANPMPLSATLGIGTGGFRSKGAIDAGSNDPNFFGGLGVKVHPRVSLATSWNGSALNMGMGLAPLDIPLTFSIGFSDVTGNTDNGASFVMNAGYSISF